MIISTITGYAIERVEKQLGNQYPIIRSMPNTAISVGKSMTCLCSNKVGEKRLPIAEAIYNGLGTTLTIEETHMQAATVLCASGIAFWMRLIRATTQGGVQLGFDADVALKNVHCRQLWAQQVYSSKQAAIQKKKSIGSPLLEDVPLPVSMKWNIKD